MFDATTLPQMRDDATEMHVMRHSFDLVNRCRPGTLAHRLAAALDVVRTAVLLKDRLLRTVPAASVALPLLVLLCNRLGPLLNRFLRTVERGTPPRPRKSRAQDSEPAGCALAHQPPPTAPQPPPTAMPFPRTSLWLQRLVPEAMRGRAALASFVALPEVAVQLAVTPQAHRTLRAICRMLAIPFQEHLRLPPKPTKSLLYHNTMIPHVSRSGRQARPTVLDPLGAAP